MSCQCPVQQEQWLRPAPHHSDFGKLLISSTLDDNDSGTLHVPSNLDDLSISIAYHKGTRTCIKHPILDFVSFRKLSPNFRAFTTNLS